MNKYIDADKLIAEIESIKLIPQTSADYNDGRDDMKMIVLDLIDSLQQEQPEVCEPEYGPYARQYPKSKVSQEQHGVDLEKYIENEINHYGLSLYEASYGTFSASQIDRIIRNAFELGLNARKEE